MCSNWIVNGVYCSSGADLARACGADAARRVNRLYADIGQESWRTGENGERITIPITAEQVESLCLCHVDHDLMETEFGGPFYYDPEEDAFRQFEAKETET